MNSFNIYSRGDIYELAYPGFEGDCEYYCSIANKGRVLYLGIGTGRIFSHLYQSNPKTFGIDISPSMLSYLFSKYPVIPRSNVIEGDVLSIKLEKESYDLIVAPYAFLNYFTYKEIIQLLNNVHKWLMPNGIFITDLISPYKNPSFSQDREIYSHFSTSDGALVHIDIEYDYINQMFVETSQVTKNGNTEIFTLENFYYYPNEINILFEYCGFRINSMNGGYHSEEMTIAAEPIVIHASPLHQGGA